MKFGHKLGKASLSSCENNFIINCGQHYPLQISVHCAEKYVCSLFSQIHSWNIFSWSQNFSSHGRKSWTISYSPAWQATLICWHEESLPPLQPCQGWPCMSSRMKLDRHKRALSASYCFTLVEKTNLQHSPKQFSAKASLQTYKDMLIDRNPPKYSYGMAKAISCMLFQVVWRGWREINMSHFSHVTVYNWYHMIKHPFSLGMNVLLSRDETPLGMYVLITCSQYKDRGLGTWSSWWP